MSQEDRVVNTQISLGVFKRYAAAVVQAEERLDYKPGQIVFYEGHKAYGVYVLRQGRIRLFQQKDDVEKLIRIVTPIALLGVDEVRDAQFFRFGAKAETDVLVSFFGQSLFRETAISFQTGRNKIGKGGKKKP